MKNIGKTILIFIIAFIAGILLLFAAFLLPKQPMRDNLKYSMLAIAQENGQSCEILYGLPSTFDSLFTDSIMMLSSVYESDHSLAEAVAAIYRPDVDEDWWQPTQSLLNYLETGQVDYEASYSRYWHGYLVLLKPLLLLLNFEEIKLLNLLLQGGLFLYLIVRMRDRGLKELAAAFAAAYFLMFPIAMAFSLSMAICDYIALLGMAILIRRPVIAANTLSSIWFFMGLGIAAAYFDFLTFPLITLGFPLVLALALRKDQDQNLRYVITSCASWGASYVAFWASKWIFGCLVLKENVIADAIQTIFFRTSSEGGNNRFTFYFQTLFKNLKMWNAIPYLVLLVILIILAVRGIFFNHKKPDLKRLAPYLLVAVLPFLWYAVILNHSYEHAAYTFRILTITVFAGLGSACRGGDTIA